MDNNPTYNLAKQTLGIDTFYLDLRPENVDSIRVHQNEILISRPNSNSCDAVTCLDNKQAIECAQRLSNQVVMLKIARAAETAEEIYDEPTISGEAILMLFVAIITLAIAVKVIFF